jgi:hypothetical protein
MWFIDDTNVRIHEQCLANFDMEAGLPADSHAYCSRVLVLLPNLLPHHVYGVIVASNEEWDDPVDRAVDELEMEDALVWVIGCFVTHSELAEPVRDKLLERLPKFPFGSIEWLVKGTPEGIRDLFEEIVADEVLHYKCLMQLRDSELETLRAQLNRVKASS